jgi:hypothetical protein
MAPFQYDSYRNPYVGTIGDLILRRGDIAARQAEQVAAAQARATEASGQAWAGAVGNIAQTVAAIPQQIQQQKRQGLADEADRLAIDQRRQQLTTAQRVEQTKQRINQLASDPGIFNEDGTFNLKSLAARMSTPPDGAVGPVQPPDLGTIAGIIDPINKSLAEARTARVQWEEHKTNTLARIASTAFTLGAPNEANPRGSYLEHAQLGLAAALKSGLITQQEANSFLVPMVERPEAVPHMLQALAGRSTAAPIKLGEHDRLVNPLNPTQVLVGGTTTLKTRAELAADAANPESPTRDQSKKALDLMTTPTSNEWKDVLLDGKPAKVFVDPKTKTVTDLAGRVIDTPETRITPVPPASVQIHNAQQAGAAGDWTKTGDDFLKTVPAQWRQTVKKIANYDEDPTKVASMRGGMRETLMQWVNQVNPAYDASQFTNRAPTRKAFTTGTQGQQINAINTAIGHIDQIVGLSAQMNNSSFTPGNDAFNRLRTLFGSANVTNFETLKEALAGEVASVLSKSGATVSGIEAAKQSIKSSASPQQLAGYVQTLIPVMGSKLAAFDYQYHQAMGADDAFSALSPTSKQILEKHGFDPAHPEIGGPRDTNAVSVPTNVAAALKSVGPGRHTLSDGSVWIVNASGTITKVK